MPIVTDPAAVPPPIRPLNDRVLIRRQDAEPTTRGGLVIPAQARGTSNLCVVVAVGERVAEDGTRTPLQVVVGDQVLVGKFEGDPIRHAEVDYLMVREDQILAVVEP